MSAPALEVRGVDLETLQVLRAMVGAGSAQAGVLLRTARPVADGLSPAGVLAVRRTVGMGLVRCLAVGGGARREHFASYPSGSVAGRLWQRHPTPALTVTALPIYLVQWALREPLAASDHGACGLVPLTENGDIALAYLLARLLVEAGLQSVLAQRVFRDNPLVRVAWPAAFADLPPFDVSDFRRFIRCQSVLIEGFHHWLAEHILGSDAFAASAGMASVAESRRATYAAWLAACQQERRLDLALPLVDAAVAAMSRPAPVLRVDETASARDRSTSARAGTVLAEQVIALASCLDHMGNLDFFDEGYAEAQRLRHRWAGLERVRGIASGRIRDVAGV